MRPYYYHERALYPFDSAYVQVYSMYDGRFVVVSYDRVAGYKDSDYPDLGAMLKVLLSETRRIILRR